LNLIFLKWPIVYNHFPRQYLLRYWLY
jgi:hypothetical protein